MSENSRKSEKGVVFGRTLTWETIFSCLYMQQPGENIISSHSVSTCPKVILRIKLALQQTTLQSCLFHVEKLTFKKSVFSPKRGCIKAPALHVLKKKEGYFQANNQPKGSIFPVFFILENADTSYYTH